MTVVTDFTALLAINSYATARWNNPADLQTPVIVTYSFTDAADVPGPTEGAYAADSFTAFNAAQEANFRDAVAVFESVAGVVFVEVADGGMIDIYNANGSAYGGWANYPSSSYTSTSFGDLVIDSNGNYNEGSYAFTTLLHELGHAMGLEHSHEGENTLDEEDDNFGNTVMTYNLNWPEYPSVLGPMDIEALQYMYGTPVDTSAWSFAQGNTRFEITASSGDDVIMGVSGQNLIKGKEGADEIWGRDESDKILGDAGHDTIHGMYGGDIIRGGNGNDTIWGFIEGASNFSDDDDRLLGGNGDDTIYGQAGDDTIRGEQGDDILDGGAENDTIFGGAGKDTLIGGSGTDDLNGGAGNDTLNGGDSGDTMDGGTGNDVLFGDDGWDTMDGGSGNDTLDGGDGSNTMTGGTGIDTFVFANAEEGQWNTITDYEMDVDVLDLSGTGREGQNLWITNLSGGDTYIRIGTSSDNIVIVLEGYDASEIEESILIF